MTSPAPIPTERLEEMLRGTEGVTPGPWSRHESQQETSVQWHNHNGIPSGTVVVVPWGRSEHNLANAHRDAEHIARLDPDTVRSIVTELLELRKYAANINEALNTGDGSYRP